jgi:hypothetical protein
MNELNFRIVGFPTRGLDVLSLMELGCSIMDFIVTKESLQSEPTVVPKWFATSTFGLMSLFTIMLLAILIDVFL